MDKVGGRSRFELGCVAIPVVCVLLLVLAYWIGRFHQELITENHLGDLHASRVEELLAQDPFRFDQVTVSRGPLSKYSVSGQVESSEDLDFLKGELIRLFGEQEAGEVLAVDVSAQNLAGVLYPHAVIRFQVGERPSQELVEGLHHKSSRRERGHLTGVDVNGDEFALEWDYLGSDEDSDHYRIELQLPGEERPSRDKELHYFGEPFVTVYKTEKVSVTIALSREATNENFP